MDKQTKNYIGFTIVELLIVVVVIAILAAITTVAFNGIQRNTIESSMKEALRSTSMKMQEAYVHSESYPDAFPSGITAPTTVGLALTVVPDNGEFCINATSVRYSDMHWHISQRQQLTQGLCPGEVIVASIIGDYSSEGSTSPPINSIVTVDGSGGGFKLVSNETWESVTLSWNEAPGAVRYELQSRKPGTTHWYLHKIADGNGGHTSTNSTNLNDPTVSAQIPASTTSVTWTNIISRPTGPEGQEYRLRAYTSAGAQPWYTLVFAPDLASLTKPQNFTVLPTDYWSATRLSWTGTENNTVPDARIEIQTRIAGGTWYLRALTDGGLNVNPASSVAISNALYSAQTPPSTISLEWTNQSSRPTSSGVDHEYRIRLRSNSIPGVASDWVTANLAAPSNADMAVLSNFQVTPSPTWSSVTLSWSAADARHLPAPAVEIQTRIAGGTWYYRNLSNGNTNVNITSATLANANYSAQAPITSTPLVWTGASIIPTTGTSHEFRIRLHSNKVTGIASNWLSATLTRP